MTIEDFIRMGLALFVVLVAAMVILHFTDNTEAISQCQAADHSRDVCEFTLNP